MSINMFTPALDTDDFFTKISFSALMGEFEDKENLFYHNISIGQSIKTSNVRTVKI